MSKPNLTAEETKAIAALKKVAMNWPKSLWLFSASGLLCVMKYPEDGSEGLTKQGGVDQKYVVDTIKGIPNDGGDW